MSYVVYNGLTVNRQLNANYVDTILALVKSTSGSPDEFDVISNYRNYYNNYYQNISDDSANYLSNLGYKLIVKRLMPWLHEIYDRTRFSYDYNKLKYYYSISFKDIIPTGYYLRLYTEKYNIIIWFNNDNLYTLPNTFNIESRTIIKDSLDDQIVELSNVLNGYGFTTKIGLNSIDIYHNFIVNVEVGRYKQQLDYPCIRFFNRDYVISDVSGEVSEATHEYIKIKYDSKYKVFVNPDKSTYYPVVSVGSTISVGSNLFTKFLYSFPRYNKTYDPINTTRNLDINYLTSHNLTYSIKINIPINPIMINDNGYIILNNGMYNIMIWFIDPITLTKVATNSMLEVDESLSSNYYMLPQGGSRISLYHFNETENKIYYSDKIEFERLNFYSFKVDYTYDSETEQNIISGITLISTSTGEQYISTNYDSGTESGTIDVDSKTYTYKLIDDNWTLYNGWNSYRVNDDYVTLDKSQKYSFTNIDIDDFEKNDIISDGVNFFIIRIENDSKVIESPSYESYIVETNVVGYTQFMNGIYELDEFGSPVEVQSNDIKLNILNKLSRSSVIFTPTYPSRITDVPVYYHISPNDYPSKDEQALALVELFKSFGMISSYDYIDSISVLNYEDMRIIDISNIFSVTNDINSTYDMLCRYNDNYKVLDIRSKVASNNNDLRVSINLNSIGSYSLLVEKLDYLNDIIDSEEYTVSFNKSDSNFISNVLKNSNLIEAITYSDNICIPNGIYKLNRTEEYNPTDLDIKTEIWNMTIEDRFELMIDSGILSVDNKKSYYDKFKDYSALKLFTSNNHYTYESNKYLNTSFSYPNIFIDNKEYPNYISFLDLSITYNSYTGSINIDKMVDIPTKLDLTKLMSIYSDEYRYVLTHNFINTSYGFVPPELVMILSRIKHYVYQQLIYKDEESIRISLAEKFEQIYNLSSNILKSLNVESIKIVNHKCTIVLSLEVELFRVDPINVKVVLNM